MARAPSMALVQDMPRLAALDGPWKLRFTPGWGAPEDIELQKLQSWTQHKDPGVKHYSGAVLYSQDFDAPPPSPGQKTLLDLGEVCVLAGVTLNGKDLGVSWRPPYSYDVSETLLPGKNHLEVRVVNLWTNRLIADSGLPETGRKTWASWNPYRPGDTLLKSGLLGPVLLRRAP
jgi:hypothetical protein